ncbi:DNA polymerase III subunit delta [Metabacillus hrfriensis]|uniref:DNA polymerase III subunit delta n=1 Tax=Metabacillus hrfriensis TaxID=3048891 RepID=A0ACD4R834_9BACI|nr:DNA polymerase III subunit delta [Metabacillus sp. CT-WN-B3]USK27392.1 DNA polymerase III subunit delta [Bacillus sp. CMF21]WHZ56604.1 DNA polymerase III subunit delta [Metabacillus sp. CT-WN-B3]
MISNVWKDIKNKQLKPAYLLLGKESYLIQETVQLIIEAALDPSEIDFNLAQYDLSEVPLESAIEDAETLPFLGEKRVVILKNPQFLTSEKKKEKIEHRIDKLEEYLKSPAPYTILVIVAPFEKLDERKKITKAVKKMTEAVEMNGFSEHETKKWMNELADANAIALENSARDQLYMLTAGNLMAISQEMKKLSTYTGEGGIIREDIVSALVSRTLEQNIFELIEKVIRKDRTRAMQIFYDLLKANEEPIKILSLLINQFRLILQVKELSVLGYGQQQIAGNLKVHPFRVKLAMQQAQLFQTSELTSIMNQLGEADYEMKTGKMDKRLAVELFLLRLFK